MLAVATTSRSRVSPSEKPKPDEYLSSVREVEQRVSRARADQTKAAANAADKSQPLATVPPRVLQALPQLPKDAGLEYRFVQKHLILFDTRANLIVDFLLNAIP